MPICSRSSSTAKQWQRKRGPAFLLLGRPDRLTSVGQDRNVTTIMLRGVKSIRTVDVDTQPETITSQRATRGCVNIEGISERVIDLGGSVT